MNTLEYLIEKIKEYDFPESKLFYGNSCAIVGNSACILDEFYGKEIDNFDFVIRFNQARVKGYENFVGSKTDLRIVNTHSFTAYNGVNCDSNIETFSKFSKNIFNELNEFNFLATSDSNISKIVLDFPNIKFNKISDDTTHFINNLTGGRPTTGFLGTILCLNKYQSISMYGFDFYQGDNDHYYENVIKYDRSEVHKISNEKQIIEYLNSKNKIKLINKTKKNDTTISH